MDLILEFGFTHLDNLLPFLFSFLWRLSYSSEFKRRDWGVELKRRQVKYGRNPGASCGAGNNGRLEVVDVRELGMERVVGFAHMQFVHNKTLAIIEQMIHHYSVRHIAKKLMKVDIRTNSTLKKKKKNLWGLILLT